MAGVSFLPWLYEDRVGQFLNVIVLMNCGSSDVKYDLFRSRAPALWRDAVRCLCVSAAEVDTVIRWDSHPAAVTTCQNAYWWPQFVWFKKGPKMIFRLLFCKRFLFSNIPYNSIVMSSLRYSHLAAFNCARCICMEAFTPIIRRKMATRGAASGASPLQDLSQLYFLITVYYLGSSSVNQ